MGLVYPFQGSSLTIFRKRKTTMKNVVITQKELVDVKRLYNFALDATKCFKENKGLNGNLYYEDVKDDGTFHVSCNNFFEDWRLNISVSKRNNKADKYLITVHFVKKSMEYFLGLVADSSNIDYLSVESIDKFKVARKSAKTGKELNSSLKTFEKHLNEINDNVRSSGFDNVFTKMDNLVKRNVKHNKNEVEQDKENIIKYGTGKYYFLTRKYGTLCYPEWYYNSEEGKQIWNYYISDKYDKHYAKTYELDVKFISSNKIPYGTVKPMKKQAA